MTTSDAGKDLGSTFHELFCAGCSVSALREFSREYLFRFLVWLHGRRMRALLCQAATPQVMLTQRL
jgi:hypothetical protein